MYILKCSPPKPLAQNDTNVRQKQRGGRTEWLAYTVSGIKMVEIFSVISITTVVCDSNKKKILLPAISDNFSLFLSKMCNYYFLILFSFGGVFFIFKTQYLWSEILVQAFNYTRMYNRLAQTRIYLLNLLKSVNNIKCLSLLCAMCSSLVLTALPPFSSFL